MLGVPLDLSPVGVHISLGVTQAPIKERLKLIPCDRERSVSVISPLVLLSTDTDPVLEERRDKKNLSRPHSSSGSKVVFTLLTEVVAVHVGLSTIYVWGTGLQLFASCLGNDASRSGSKSGNGSKNGSKSGDSSLQNSFKILLQVILGVFGDTNSSSKGVSNGGFHPQGSSGLVGQFVTQLER